MYIKLFFNRVFQVLKVSRERLQER